MLRSAHHIVLFGVLILLFAACGPSRPSSLPENSWWDQVCELPTIPSEDSLDIRDFSTPEFAPLSDDLYRQFYGKEPASFPAQPDSVWMIAHRRAGSGLGVLLYRADVVADHPFPCLEYIELNREGESSGPVMLAAEDHMTTYWRVRSIFRARYGLQQVTEFSSEWMTDSTQVSDTLFTRVLNLDLHPGQALPDTTRIDHVWRLW